jgi:hypothetical protein
MEYRYEVSESNEIFIWHSEQEAPIIYQPVTPDNEQWPSSETAVQWAESYIDNLLNPPALEIIEDAEIVEEETNA